MLRKAAVFLERRLGPLLPVHHGRHRSALEGGAVSPEAERRARESWWGLDQRWFAGGTPPRQHNHVEPLVDGASYFAALHRALAEARHYVYIAGWCLTPFIPLVRDTPEAMAQSRLLDVLSEAAQRLPVRLLLWGGGPLVLQPTSGTMKQVLRTIEQHGSGDLQCRLDDLAHATHCHHQKTVVVDGRVAFVGGMDLTTFSGDRWDLPAHPLRAGVNWHDAELRLEGPVVADVEANFRQRWRAVTGQDDLPHRDPPADAAWQTSAQVLRTIARRTYDFAPNGEFGIHHAYLEAIRGARRLIYLENQYLWSPYVMDALTEAINRPRSEPFRVVIVLPARATSGKWDNDKHVQQLQALDEGRNVVAVYCLYASGPSSGLEPFVYRPAYVHAKIAIFDDEWFMVGSANLNNRGLVTDSEMNVAVSDPDLARRLRVQLWAEHLAMGPEEIDAADPLALVDGAWRIKASENAAIVKAGDRPLTSAVHPYQPGRMPGSQLLDEAEALTFEH